MYSDCRDHMHSHSHLCTTKNGDTHTFTHTHTHTHTRTHTHTALKKRKVLTVSLSSEQCRSASWNILRSTANSVTTTKKMKEPARTLKGQPPRQNPGLIATQHQALNLRKQLKVNVLLVFVFCCFFSRWS